MLYWRSLEPLWTWDHRSSQIDKVHNTISETGSLMRVYPFVMGPRPQVIGNARSEVSEVELEHLTNASRWLHPLTPEELIDALFCELERAAVTEEETRVSLDLRDTQGKLNRRQIYMDSQKCATWKDRSSNFLERCDEIVSLSTDKLYSAIAMQHFLDVDRADATSSAEHRCSEDTFSHGINDQFLVDATRGRYTVDGEVFHYEQVNTSEAEEAFVSRLTEAVRAATTPQLLGHVTSTISQSGLAALERASLCNIAVSGGVQDIDYTLAADPVHPDGVIVTLRVYRHGFTEYLLDGSGDNFEPQPSDKTSSIMKFAVVSFSADGSVDVLNLEELVDIRFAGKHLPTESFYRSLPAVPRGPTALDGRCKRKLCRAWGCIFRCPAWTWPKDRWMRGRRAVLGARVTRPC